LRTYQRLTAVAATLLLLAPGARAGEVVRIAVATGLKRTAVFGSGLTMLALQEGATPVSLPNGRAAVALAGDGVTVNGARLAVPAATFRATGPLRTGAVDISLWQGELEVRRAANGLTVIHSLPLEDYVAAVVGSEMPPSFPPAALKAQAVAARTYAIFKKLESVAVGRPWHLGATALDQVYRGARVDPRARGAAEATVGEVLAYRHAPIEAYFHSACGGRTERGADALGRDLPYLASVECGFCKRSPQHRWSVRIPDAELGKLVGLANRVRHARVIARTASGRAERVEFEGGGRQATLAAVDLRQRLGFERLPSLAFDVHSTRGAVEFEGRGSGHGAGLCQWGAAGAARAGEGYRAILARYYPGTEIIKMY